MAKMINNFEDGFDSFMSSKDRAEAAECRTINGLVQYGSGQKTRAAQTAVAVTGAPVVAKGFSSAVIATWLNSDTGKKASVRRRMLATAYFDTLQGVEALPHGFPESAVVKILEKVWDSFPALRESIKAEKTAALTTAQIAARAAKAAESTAKRAKQELEDAINIIQAHGRAGTLPPWFIAHMGQLAKKAVTA